MFKEKKHTPIQSIWLLMRMTALVILGNTATMANRQEGQACHYGIMRTLHPASIPFSDILN